MNELVAFKRNPTFSKIFFPYENSFFIFFIQDLESRSDLKMC